jgi:enamine deaminase RidA (YjgF/YER057c/UK114 family)
VSIEFLNPADMVVSPAFSQGVAISGSHKLLLVGGQNAVDASGNVVGKGDLAAQTRQIFHNLDLVLREGGAGIENVVKWTIYVVQGQDVRLGFAVFQDIWGPRPNPPAISVVFVAALGRPDLLAELEAIAVI